MSAKYIIRLDDASEFMHYEKWNPYFEMFDKFDIKPIIAVIPNNKDPKMIHENPDFRFWDKVRIWQGKGYHIALHGYEHLYSTKRSGLVGRNKRSEFAGIPLEKQKSMLEKGYRKFKEEGVHTNIFVAPAHSFDKNTIKALKAVTKIEHISDGFFINPFYKFGIRWIPVQISKPKIKKHGVWTICHHPETSQKKEFELLELFIDTHQDKFINLLNINFRNRISIEDIIFKNYYLLKMKAFRIYRTVKIYFSIIT